MNIQYYWSFFLKRTLRRKSVWIPLIAYLFLFLIQFFLAEPFQPWPVEKASDFLKYCFGLQIVFSLNWFFFPNLLSWVLWWRFDDIGQETQTDGTDLFLLSTETPTNRKKIFLGKAFFLTSFLIGLHLIYALLEMTLSWKLGVFDAYSGINAFLFMIGNFLVAPLFFFLPSFIFLFSLASLKSIWYTILRWLGTAYIISSVIINLLLLAIWGKEAVGEWGEKVSKFWNNLGSNYLYILAIIGLVFFLSLITFRLAYKDYQEKDLS
ncbi:MAG: hypothetical protein GBAus27B_000327 [Mycoplasmataceae bacterium]|nr:MAG: hypothetical protein GBAus27B_000327 [Mycoplasmataceae bacterium]